MSLLKKVLVFSEDLAAFSELCAGAKSLTEEVLAVVLGTKEDAEKVAQFGAKTYWLGEKADNRMVEDYTTTIGEIVNNEKPSLVLIKGTKRGRLVAGRLGVLLRAGVVPDVFSFNVDDEKGLTMQRLVYGGAAVRTEKPVSEISIALVGSGTFEASNEVVSGEVVAMEDIRAEGKVTCIEVRPKEGETVDLSYAKRVVSVGRGLAKQEDLLMVEELAATIGAEMACSRPIAEGENWMAGGRYIGVSGAMIKPDLYFALGISGQVQHMVGVNQAKTIVAVNKDKNAPIFDYADFGIVGDLYKVIPELTKLLKN